MVERFLSLIFEVPRIFVVLFLINEEFFICVLFFLINGKLIISVINDSQKLKKK